MRSSATATPRDPKELLEIRGVRETQQYLVERGPEGVPRPGRVDPRQAHRAHRAPDDRGGSPCRSRATPTSCPASGSTRKVYADVNRRSCRRARRPPRAVPSSWASPRRRWPPTRGCRRPRSRRPPGCSPRPRSSRESDGLLGLKENIIIGKLIPAGTGMQALPRHRDRGARLPADGVLLLGCRVGPPSGSPASAATAR